MQRFAIFSYSLFLKRNYSLILYIFLDQSENHVSIHIEVKIEEEANEKEEKKKLENNLSTPSRRLSHASVVYKGKIKKTVR